MIVVDNLFFLDNKNNDYQLPLTYMYMVSLCEYASLFPWLYSMYSLYFHQKGSDMGSFGTKDY